MKIIHSVKSGIKELDEITGGFFPEELTIVGARPGIGKTMFILNSLKSMIENHSEKPVLFSIEMSKVCVLHRLASMITGVPLSEIRSGGVKDETAFLQVKKMIEESDLRIDASPKLSIDELCLKVKFYVQELGRNIVFIDYLGLIGVENENMPIYEQISQITRKLKIMARELCIPVVCACQVARSIEEDEEPKLNQLRGSSTVEQDADTIIFVHKPNSDDAGNAAFHRELIIAKNRNGDTGRVSV